MKRKVTAILAADIVGFSRLIAEDEEGTLQRLAAYRSIFEDYVARCNGRIFNTAGDSIMCEFENAVDAVKAAIDIQEALRARNLAYPANRWLQFRIGISTGEAVERNGDLLGAVVNVAARLEKLARAGGICISKAVHEAVSDKLPVPFVDLGERRVKNIPLPVHVFAIAWPGSEPPPWQSLLESPALRAFASWAAGACAVLLVIAGTVVLRQQLASSVAPQQSNAAAPMPPQQAAHALSLSADPVKAFSGFTQRGGRIDSTKSAPGLYHNALLLEAKGEVVGAHRAYYTLASMGLEFIDLHLRYASLVRTQEGEATARQVYDELNEDVPTRATKLVHALQLERDERLAGINALIEAHPDFAPAYYFLAEEHSEDRMGSIHGLRDRQIELAALTEVLKAGQEGRLAAFFIDRNMASSWIDKARNRHAALQALLASADDTRRETAASAGQ